jgi:CDP-glycerol glycerophosphotransferase
VVRPNLSRRIIVNLWHGIPLNRLFALANMESRVHADRIGFRRKERADYQGLVASSDVDSYAMAAIFHPIPHDHGGITGLPRNDFLSQPDAALPAFLRSEVEQIRGMKAGRRLVTYAPTFRESHVAEASCYQFSDEEVQRLIALLERHDAVLGFRMHYFRKGNQLFNLERYLDGDRLLDLGHAQINEIAPVLRETDVLITDYSSVYIDALYLDRPVISFAYDLEHYSARQNGLLYDMELAFPGPVIGHFDALLEALDQELAGTTQVASERYRMARRLFFKYTDDSNSVRLVERLQRLITEREG